MPLEQIVVLALIQGITEFLPISSSGHLILVPALTGWPDQGVVTDMVTKLAMLIVLGTIPAVVLGVILDLTGFMDTVRHMPQIVAWNAIIFGALLYLCDRYGHSIRRMSDMTLSPALIIGVAQAIAIIPGTSRSGITMTAARALGFERPEAARFAFAVYRILLGVLLLGLIYSGIPLGTVN